MKSEYSTETEAGVLMQCKMGMLCHRPTPRQGKKKQKIVKAKKKKKKKIVSHN